MDSNLNLDTKSGQKGHQWLLSGTAKFFHPKVNISLN